MKLDELWCSVCGMFSFVEDGDDVCVNCGSVSSDVWGKEPVREIERTNHGR